MNQIRKPGRPPQLPVRRRGVARPASPKATDRYNKPAEQLKPTENSVDQVKPSKAGSIKAIAKGTENNAKPQSTKSLGNMSPSATKIHRLKTKRSWLSELKLRLANFKKLIYISLASLAALLILAFCVLFFAPSFKVQNIETSGVEYLDSAQITAILSQSEGDPLLFADTNSLERQISEIAGVESIKIKKVWPNTLLAELTTRTPVAIINTQGVEKIVDASGVQLPPAAIGGQTIPTFTVQADEVTAPDVEAALMEAFVALPPRVSQAVESAQASTISNLTFTINSDAGVKTVIWGSATDTELKVSVLEVLLGQPGNIIDLTVPQAPTVRN